MSWTLVGIQCLVETDRSVLAVCQPAIWPVKCSGGCRRGVRWDQVGSAGGGRVRARECAVPGGASAGGDGCG